MAASDNVVALELLERVHRFPIQVGIHGFSAACESSIESVMEARDGASLQPGFA
jgi:hypothetical protein